jgi:hypothetical protein
VCWYTRNGWPCGQCAHAALLKPRTPKGAGAAAKTQLNVCIVQCRSSCSAAEWRTRGSGLKRSAVRCLVAPGQTPIAAAGPVVCNQQAASVWSVRDVGVYVSAASCSGACAGPQSEHRCGLLQQLQLDMKLPCRLCKCRRSFNMLSNPRHATPPRGWECLNVQLFQMHHQYVPSTALHRTTGLGSQSVASVRMHALAMCVHGIHQLLSGRNHRCMLATPLHAHLPCLKDVIPPLVRCILLPLPAAIAARLCEAMHAGSYLHVHTGCCMGGLMAWGPQEGGRVW